MKPFTLLPLFQLITLLIMTYGITAQTIYVKPDAIGVNDGTTWENAFTDFSVALDSASDGAMLWVAAGVYHPGGSSPDVNSVFTVRQNVSIYGGFAGSEVNLEERDPSVNLTVLSGDINEDDIQDDFSINKMDNTRHVMYVDSLLNQVIIDGFTIKGGNTTDNANANIYDRSGGGIHALAPVSINQCHLTGNFGRAGGGIYLGNRASSSIITNCLFSSNKTTSRGAGLFALSVSDIQVTECLFSENNTIRGSLCFFTCMDVNINHCLFEGNINASTNTASAGIGSFDNINLSITDCDFSHNSAYLGGAIVINGAQIAQGTLTNVRIEGCTFGENSASQSGGAILCSTIPDILILRCGFISDSAGTGGGIYIDQPQNYITDTNDIRIDSCLFVGNVAGDKGGGALFMRYTSAKVEHSLFENNTTDGLLDGGGGHVFQNCPGRYVIYRNSTFRSGRSLGFGGAATALGVDAQYFFESCNFSNNSSERAGGAVDNSSGAVSVYRNCMFSDNASVDGLGGALSLAHDSTRVHVEHSIFIRNQAAGNGGAIAAIEGSNIIELDHCILDSNTSLNGFGGAISIVESGDDNIASLSINNSIFSFNSSTVQGGALNIADANTHITNCVFSENKCSEQGIGAAISIKSSDQDTMQAMIVNSTIVDNHGYLADGIGQEEGSVESMLTTEIQNCIFRNQGSTNYNIETGTPELVSLGGNMSDDESMYFILIHKKDLNQTAPFFNLDYSLMSNSPGIDGGVALGAPEFDILGNPRVNEPDMGAYENQMPVSVKKNMYRDQNDLAIYPNPVKDQNPTAMLMNTWRGEIRVQLSDLEGRVVFSEKIQKSDDLHLLTIPMQHLNAGNYQFHISNGRVETAKNIVKVQ